MVKFKILGYQECSVRRVSFEKPEIMLINSRFILRVEKHLYNPYEEGKEPIPCLKLIMSQGHDYYALNRAIEDMIGGDAE